MLNFFRDYRLTIDEVLASMVGSCAGYSVAHPFDTVKTRLQVQGDLLKRGTVSIVYKGPIDCFWQTYSKEGIPGLYKGFLSPLIGQVGVNVVLFPINAFCNKFFYKWNVKHNHENPKLLSWSQIFLSGVIAGTGALIITQPSELVKSRLQVQTQGSNWRPEQLSSSERRYRWFKSANYIDNAFQSGRITKDSLRRINSSLYYGSIDCGMILFKEHGLIRGLGRGTSFTWLRDTSFGVYFLVYEGIKRGFMYLNGYDINDPQILSEATTDIFPMWQLFIAGGSAGFGAWVATFPFDVAKSRVQIVPRAEFLEKAPNPFRAVYNIAATEGAQSLYRGLGATVLRSLPLSGVLMLFYEWTKTFMDRVVW